MKKALKILGVISIVILSIMIAIPFFLSNKLEGIVKQEANKILTAEFDFKALDLSLFKNFPKASLTIKDFWIKGINEFKNDTLAQGSELTATVNILSLFKDEGFEIDQIILNDGVLHAIINPDGKENWDILISSDKDFKEDVEGLNEENNFTLQLKKLVANNFSLSYKDLKENQYAEIKNSNLELKGDFNSKKTTLSIVAQTPSLSFQSSGIPFLNKIAFDTKMNIDADLENNVYTFKKNEIKVNAIHTNLDGWIALKEEDAIEMDLKLNTSEVGFKEILSLIPAIYSTDFKDIKTDGIASLTAYAKGVMKDEDLPSFDVTLDVKNAMFRYPSLPAGVDQIAIHANVNNPGGSADKTIIKLSPFTFRMAGNPFRIDGTITSPISDPAFNFKMSGILDLGKVKEVYPLKETSLNGLLNADIAIVGRSSYIDKEQYEKIQSSGTIQLNNMKVDSKELPNLTIDKSLLTFTPQYLRLSETTIHLGENDITLDSQLNNYIAYLIKGSTIEGSLNIQSNYLNLTDFNNNSEASEHTPDDSNIGVIEVPQNINFKMNASLKKVVVGTMTLKDVQGRIHISEGKANMSNLSVKTMDGELIMNGIYSTHKREHPLLNANFIMNNLSFAQAYKELNMVQSLAPIFNSLEGTFSGSMNIKTELNERMEPIYPTLQAVGNLKTSDLSLKNVDVIHQLAQAIKQEELINRSIKNLDLSFVIENGRLETKPFDFKMGDYHLNLSGTTGLDQTIEYKGKIKLPESMVKVKGLDTLGFIVEGNFRNPTFKIDTKNIISQSSKVLEEKAKDIITKELMKNDSTKISSNDSVKKDIKDQLKDEVEDQLLNLFKKKKNK